MGTFVDIYERFLTAPDRENRAQLFRRRHKAARLSVGNVLKPAKQTSKFVFRLAGHEVTRSWVGKKTQSASHQTRTELPDGRCSLAHFGFARRPAVIVRVHVGVEFHCATERAV